MRYVYKLCLMGLMALFAIPSLAHGYTATPHASNWMAAPHISARSSPLDCLSLAIYREARGESDQGMAGVGYVVTNRVHVKAFPDSVCGVILQSLPAGNHRVCQFSWACNKLRYEKLNRAQYRRAQMVALLVLKNAIPNPVGNAIYFHESTRHHRPSIHSVRVTRIQHHVFYADSRAVFRPLPSDAKRELAASGTVDSSAHPF